MASGSPQGRFGGFRADSSSCHQPPSHPEQVAEGEQREELGAVPGRPAGAGLQMAELAFDHPERMLDACPHLGDDVVGPLVEVVQRVALGGLAQFKRQANDPGDRL